MPKISKKTSLGKLGRVERERRNTAIIKFSLIGIVVFVVVILVGGSIWESAIKPKQPVAVVNGQEILTGDFEAQVRYVRGDLINQHQYYSNLYSYFTQFSVNPTDTEYLQDILFQLRFQLETPGMIGPTALEGMIDNIIIRIEAENRSITVTQTEIEEAMEAEFGFYAGGLPTPTVSPTFVPTSTLSETQLALITLPPTATNTLTPTIGAEATTTGISTPTQNITPTATSIPVPTQVPTEYTQDLYTLNRDDYLGFVGISIDQNSVIIEANLYRQKLRDAITADLDAEREQVWLRQLQFEDQETADEFAALLQDGEWNQLAAEFFPEDQYVSQTLGDYGWVNLDDLIPSVSEVAAELPVGGVSSPIETDNGWFIFQILGHETRPLSPAEYDGYKEQVFAEWLNDARSSYEIEYMDYWTDRIPNDPRLPPAQDPDAIPGL